MDSTLHGGDYYVTITTLVGGVVWEIRRSGLCHFHSFFQRIDLFFRNISRIVRSFSYRKKDVKTQEVPLRKSLFNFNSLIEESS